MESLTLPESWKRPAAAAVAVLYIVTGKLGFLAAISPGNVTAVWPPSGIALAAVLLLGAEVWPGIWLGSFLLNAWFFSGITDPFSPAALAVSCGIGAGSTIQALLGAKLIRLWIGPRGPVDSPDGVFRFVGIETLCCTVAPTLGAACLCLGGFAAWDAFPLTWRTWWVGDAAGAILVAPLILILNRRPAARWDAPRALEAAAFGALLLAGCYAVFVDRAFSGLLLHPYSLFPMLLWAALRFGQGGVVLSTLAVSATALWGTAHGLGAFGQGVLPGSVAALQTFVSIFVVTGLVLAASLSEYRRAQRELREALEGLERRAEERTKELFHSEERFRLLVEGVGDYAILMLDLNGFVTSWNAGAERIEGYRADEIVGRHFSLFYTGEDVMAGKPRLLLKTAQTAGRVEDEGWRVRKDGSRFWADVIITAVTDETGRLRGFAKVTRDLTAQKKTSEELQRKTEELARSNAELEVFATTASHDLQEPLRKIVAFSDLVMKRSAASLDATSLDFLGRMQTSAQRMTKLILDLLQLSRVVRDNRPFEVVDLNAVVTAVLTDLEPRVAESNAAISAGRLPELRAHPFQMHQLFQNLIGNALKFRRKNGPPRIEIASRGHEDGFVEISVADNGIGFDAEFAEKVFQPFTRLNTRTEYEGSGIGLAICRKIMLRHGGWISAKSAPGEGSVFTVTLPSRRPP